MSSVLTPKILCQLCPRNLPIHGETHGKYYYSIGCSKCSTDRDVISYFAQHGIIFDMECEKFCETMIYINETWKSARKYQNEDLVTEIKDFISELCKGYHDYRQALEAKAGEKAHTHREEIRKSNEIFAQYLSKYDELKVKRAEMKKKRKENQNAKYRRAYLGVLPFIPATTTTEGQTEEEAQPTAQPPAADPTRENRERIARAFWGVPQVGNPGQGTSGVAQPQPQPRTRTTLTEEEIIRRANAKFHKYVEDMKNGLIHPSDDEMEDVR